MNHQCSSCHLVFTREETYARHRRAKVCSEEQPYQFFQCPICNCLLTELKRIDLHIDVCHGFSPRLLELEPDIVVIKESQTYKCADCDLKFADNNTMLQCGLFHHNVNTEMCEICLDTFPNLESLKYHIYNNHKLHFCIICRKGLHTYFSFVHHCQLHVLESLVRRDANGKMVIELESNPQKRKRSKLFPYETTDQEAFVVSAKIPENVLDDSRLFYCHVCRKNIEGELTFIVHVKTHVLSRRLQCFICPESFVEEEDLKLHYQHVKHKQSASRTYRPEGFVCFHCSLVFENLDALMTHLDDNRVGAKYPELQKSNEVMKTVQRYVRLQAKPPAISDSLPVEWNCAEKSAGITSILNSKYAISRSARKSSKDFKYLPNTNVQSLTCPVCGFHTTTLETHLKWHFDVYTRNFKCCSGEFSSSKSLLQHVKVRHCHENTGQKCCCPFCFIMTDLKHIVKHWDGLVFLSNKVRCPVCNLVFQKKCLAHHLMVDEKLSSGVISVEVPNKHGGETATLSKAPAPKKLKAIAPKGHEFATARKTSTPKKVKGKSDANNNIAKTATKNTRDGMPENNRGNSLDIKPGNSKVVQVGKNQRKEEKQSNVNKTALKNSKRRKKIAEQDGIRQKTNNTINESSKESSKTPPVKPTSATEKQMQKETHTDKTTDQSLEDLALSNADHFEKQTRRKIHKEESASPMTKQKTIKNVPPRSDETQTKTVQPESLDTKSLLNEVALAKSPTSLIYEEMLQKSDSVFACEFCSWDFCSYDQLKDHLMRHILTLKEEVKEVLKLTCHLCARIFSKNTITKHMALCHMKDTNAHRRNRKCEDDRSKQVAYVNAVNALLDNNYFCTLCAKTEESLHLYLDHYKAIHPLIYTQEMHKFLVSTNPVIVKNMKQYNKNQSKSTSMQCKTPEILPQKKGKSTKKATSSASKAQASKEDKAAKKISPPPRKKTKSDVTDNGSGIADNSIDQPTTQQGGEKLNSPLVGKYDLSKCSISSPSMPYPYNCQVCGKGYYKRNVYLKHFKTAHPWMCSETTDGDNNEKHTDEPQEITMKESGDEKDLNQEEGAVESLPVVSSHSSPSEINDVKSSIKTTEPVTPSKKTAVTLPTSTGDLPEENVQSKIENMLASKKKSPPSTSNTRKIIRPGKPPSAFKKNPRWTNDLKQDDRQQIDEESNSAIDDPSDDNEPPGSIHMEIVTFEPNDESNKDSENQVKKEPSADAKTKSDDKAEQGKKTEPNPELKETDKLVKTVAKDSNMDDGNESEGTISNDEDEENEVEEETEEEIIESSSEDEVDSKTSTSLTKLKEVAPRETVEKLEKATPKVEATSAVEATPTDAKSTSPSAMGGYFVTNYPLVCLFCGLGFYRRHMLKSHLTKKHPNCYTPDLEKSNSFVNLNYVDVSTPNNLQTAEVLPKRSRSKFNEVMKALKPATKSTAKKANSLVVKIKNPSNEISPSPSRKRPSVEKLVIKAKKKKETPSDEIETSPEESNEEAESSDEDTDSEVECKDTAYRHKCKWCDQLFVEKRNLGKHVTRHFRGAKLNKLTCVSCFCLVERHLLKRHMHMSHSDVKLSQKRNWCARCSYSSKKSLDKHIMQAHPTLLKIECRICDARFSTTLSYNKHFQMTHGKSLDEESLMCLFCNKKFGSLDKLYCHFSIVHMKKNKSLFCALCCKYFYGRTDLENHKQEFHQNDKYQCGLCLVDFESVEACEKHVQVHKNKTDHRCPLCKFYFESIDRLTNHKKTHDQMLKCNGCEKCFKSNVEFLSHREGGKCEFTFSACCLHCDLTFDSEKTMIEHTGMHSKNPAATMEQVCSQCDQPFDTVTKLMEHIEKTHNQLPVSMKPTTGYETDGESMSRVTNDNTCDICGETFIRYEIYQEHLKKHQ